MATSRPTLDPEQLLDKIERLLDEIHAMDRRFRHELDEDGLGEEQLVAMRSLLAGPARARHAEESPAAQRSRR